MSDILPAEANAAITKLIQQTQALIAMLEEESRSVAMNDAISFSMTEQDKTRAADEYERAAAEFTRRGPALVQQADKALFDKLLTLQAQLKSVAEANNKKLGTIPGVQPSND